MRKKSGIRKNRIIGFMVGTAIGFAAWGSQNVSPWSVNENRNLETANEFMSSGSVDEEVGAETANEEAILETVREKVSSEAVDETEAPFSLHAQSAVLMDADSGRVLYGKDAYSIRPMASTTKIMTCILALELGNLEDFCEISQKAAAQPKVKLGAAASSFIRLEDLLYSLMLESHNDSAVAIAEHISGSVEAFTEEMNRKAREIGCKNTTFLTPNGLDARIKAEDGTEKIHSTTAEELARILRYCTEVSPKRDEFLTITRSENHSFSDQDKRSSYHCVNHNALLAMTPEALTGKTGFTGNAGYCYAAELSDGERKLILTLLGCGWPPHKTWKWADVKKLYQYGKDHFCYRDFRFQEDPVRIRVEDGAYKDSIYAASGTPGQERNFHLLVSENERVTAETRMPDIIKAPVAKGTAVGQIVYRLGKEVIGTSDFYTETSVAAWTPAYCMRRLFHIWLLSEM